VFTPTRLIQVSTDSAHAVQAGMMEVFEDMLYICLLIWIDDVLVYTRSFEDFLTRLEEVFQRLRKFNVKLNPQKTDLCSNEIKFEGIKFDPEMIDSLLSLPKPENAANLQKFLCGANWIRSSITEYAMEVSPLQELMEEIMRSTGSAKSSKLKSIQLKEIWKEEHSKCFESIKQIIAHSVTVAHPKDGYEVCLFTDASDFHWGVIVTQMPKEDLDLDVLVQRHEPLAFSQWNFQQISEALECD